MCVLVVSVNPWYKRHPAFWDKLTVMPHNNTDTRLVDLFDGPMTRNRMASATSWAVVILENDIREMNERLINERLIRAARMTRLKVVLREVGEALWLIFTSNAMLLLVILALACIGFQSVLFIAMTRLNDTVNEVHAWVCIMQQVASLMQRVFAMFYFAVNEYVSFSASQL